MKPLNISELESVVENLQSLVEGRLQALQSGESWCELQFYKNREMHSVLIDLSPQCPLLLPLPVPKGWPSKRTPVALFINAHLRDRYLKSVRVLRDRGRVVELVFDNEARIELRLFPRGQNLLVFCGDKKISQSKVLPLPPPMAVGDMSARTLDVLCSEFVARHLGDVSPGQQPSVERQASQAQHDKALKKKQNAREKMWNDLQVKRASPLQALGEWLKAHQTLSVPPEWQEHVDLRKSFAENLQNTFQAAKELKQKILRTEERLQIIDAEIAALMKGDSTTNMSHVKTASAMRSNSILHTAKAKGRTVDLSSGHRLFIGKSGADNLRILRAASSWDYWLHLKDEPGSHAILRRQKNEKISDSLFVESLKHLVKATYGEKAARHDGEKFLGLVVECRYVKPIKGDRLGRVTYQNERVISFVFNAL